MVLPPAVIIHGARDAKAALAPGLPVTLISAPGAALYAGCLWWASLLSAVGFTGPAFLDCGDAPGRALEALRLGLTGLILTSPPDLHGAVARVADKNVVILRTAPTALDMADPVALRALSGWLGG
ncbi:MAG: hypothetical protein B7Z75_11045 [Acidocella sp. 20-57-95]|nr:MAG: hypothetical protein B7Z75_11045 [Acidocella sp. 20-57-95]HQT63392.1 hypothetical protein [Acidocella sp.]HQU04042.1 hypothetical protein [Acidocella sp.]